MRSNLGLAGEVSILLLITSPKAFTTQQVAVDLENKRLINDEKDLNKLKLTEVKNCLAIPVLDKK